MAKNAEKEQTRDKILHGAGRTFRSLGYGGAGIDGLAKAAGVTSGAFYAHFKSKADAFREAVVLGMQDLERAVRQLRDEHDAGWLARFVDFYLGERRTCTAEESCALQSLTGEVERADAGTRRAYEEVLRAVFDATAEGIDAPTPRARRNRAIALLAMLSGGVSMARAVQDPALSREIAQAIRAELSASASPQRAKAARARPASSRVRNK